MAYATGRVKLRRSRDFRKWIPFGFVTVHDGEEADERPVRAPKGIEFDTKEKAEQYTERMLQQRIQDLRRQGIVE
jgi:hypothetical protein